MIRRLFLSVLLLLSSSAVRAQDKASVCPPPKVREELRDLPELRAQGGELATILRVELLHACVPVFDPGTQAWFSQPEMLRTYVYPDPKGPSGTWSWGFPGPTLRLRRAEPERGIAGDRISIALTNNLDADLGGTCSPACPAGTLCPRDPGTVPGFPQPQDCGTTRDVRCCCYTRSIQTWPACFHGDNTTNLHFHGSHVSPQAGQDYVLLELRPGGNRANPRYAAYGRGKVAYGDYLYRLDRFSANQAEGTHWYHPDKHGSVSLQAANGMPGALIIEGPFDDELRKLHGGKLTEKILFLQQIQGGTTTLFNPAAVAPAFLVNGQPQPKITLRPGEVQRWRFVNATAQAAAQIEIQFPEGIEVRQIAMDGVQFAPENYERQPLFPAREIALAPGNRADFLVRAPEAPASLSAGSPPLFFIEIAGEPVRDQKLPTKAQFPKMPAFLADVPQSEVVRTNDLTFSMSFGPGDPRAAFFINNAQFDPSCVNVTTRLNTAEAWKIRNTSALAHPFHTHTNPFQVIEVFDPASGGQVRKFDPPYVWQDTIALPAARESTPGRVHLRQRYLDFTGESVLHGQEDRGMMLGVQTVCKDRPDSFGKARPGAESECVEGNYFPAAPACPSPPSGR